MLPPLREVCWPCWHRFPMLAGGRDDAIKIPVSSGAGQCGYWYFYHGIPNIHWTGVPIF